MASLLDEVLGYRSGFLKGRDHFEHLLTKRRLEREESIFIGDSLHDARLAQECDVAFIARLGTFTRGDFEKAAVPLVVHDLTELCELFGLAP